MREPAETWFCRGAEAGADFVMCSRDHLLLDRDMAATAAHLLRGSGNQGPQSRIGG